MQIDEDLLREVLADPDAALRALDKVDAESSLLGYIELMWSVLEPGRRFVRGWAVEAICEHLEAISRGEIRRILMNVPPGCMKSLTTDVFWPSWEWGPLNLPSLRYVAASYSQDLTVRDNRRTRQLIQAPLYQALWGDRFTLVSDQNAKVRFDTDKTGFKIATSVGGLGTGERGDRFIIDDPHNVKDGESEAKRGATLQWFTEVVPTRVNDAVKSAQIVIMQRVHALDVSGLIIRDLPHWEHLCLPMEFEPRTRCFTSMARPDERSVEVARLRRETDPIPEWITPEKFSEMAYEEDPSLPVDYEPKFQTLTCQDRRTEDGELLWAERFPESYLEEDLKPSLRAWGGTYAEAGQLQQRPAPRAGGLFQRGDFQIVDIAPQGGQLVRGWDLAGTKRKRSPYTAGVKMRLVEGRVFIMDVVRERGTPFEVESLLTTVSNQDGFGAKISIPQDPGQAGKAQVSALGKLLHGYNFSFSPETGAKEDRARPLAAQAEAGNVFLVRGPWNDAFINEACQFPNGEFLDQIDAASRAYAKLIERRPRVIPFAPVVVEAVND